MANDLVERLRGLHVTRHPSRSIVECDEATILEAAARIEQLEAALREIADCKTYSEVSTAIKAASIARAALEGK